MAKKKLDTDKVKGKTKGLMGEFKEFVLRGNVMDMAIGVIIGSAFASIEQAQNSIKNLPKYLGAIRGIFIRFLFFIHF